MREGTKRERRREAAVRAFKSKTPPLLVDTTVLFPPKKGKGGKREIPRIGSLVVSFFFPLASSS